MKDGEKYYISYDAVEIQKDEILEVIREIDRNELLEMIIKR